MKQLPNLQEVSYVHQLLPEIIWIGLINDALGYRKGAELVAQLAKTAKQIHDSKISYNFALARSYAILATEEQGRINEALERLGILRQLRELLAPLILLYDGFPLAFLGRNDELPERMWLIERLKQTVEKHMDKYRTPGMAIQATMIYVRGITGGLFFAKEMSVPNLDAILADPESEDAKHAAGFVRSSAMMEVMPPAVDGESEWARSFWNQGLRIDKCDFGEQDDNT
jgi:hypothetical protein